MDSNSLSCVTLLLGFLALAQGDYTVTIYPEYLSQHGRAHFEAHRWNGHGGLDRKEYIAGNKDFGSVGRRWMNRDLNGDIFKNTPEDPHHRGYPDPNHFNSASIQQSLTGIYEEDIKAFGRDFDLVMVIKGKTWPHWMDTSKHGGLFPNNLDAGCELTASMLGGIKHRTGTLPKYFEVINEPDTLWQHVNWDTVIEFHRIMAHKLKSKFPGIKVGGPTYTGAIAGADKNDFRVWKMITRFLDMSLKNMDFFSFHPYSSFHSHGGSHYTRGTNEARLVGIIDLLGSYSIAKTGNRVPLIPSEYGLGHLDVDSHTPRQVSEWGYAFLHNSYMFTYLNHRAVMELVVAFILNHDTFGFEKASLFNNGKETNVAKAYRFWKNFNYNHVFLRVDSQYDGQERKISPLAVADPHTKKVTVLLHNYQQSSTNVKLVFANNWITPNDAQSTCLYLDSHKNPILSQGHSVHLNNHAVSVPSEASCYFTFQTGHNFGGTPTFVEESYYSLSQAMSIHNNVVQTNVYLSSSGTFHAAYIRFGVSNANKGANTTPRSVSINGHTVTEHYRLYDNDRSSASTLWEIYVYKVPTNTLKHNENTVRLQFAQSGGYVSALTIVVGKLSGSGGVVG